MPAMPQGGAAIGRRAATLDEAVAAAASLLRGAACPVIAGLRTDIAGAQAAAALAVRIGAALDHVEAAAALRDLDAMRQGGWIVATPALARARADLVLIVGPGLLDAWPELPAGLALDRPPTLFPERARRVLHLCPGRAPLQNAEPIGRDPGALLEQLGLLRALVAGRTVAAPEARLRTLRGAAAALRGARYGVAVWSAAQLDALTIAMLCGLIDDLNAATRFAGLPLPAPGNAAGVAQALRLDDRLSHAPGFRRRRSRGMIRGATTPPAWSKAARPTRCCGFDAWAASRRPGGGGSGPWR